MLKSRTTTALSFAGILALSACQLSDNAKKSAENSGTAADNSTKLLDLSQGAFGDGRQSGARQSRKDAFAEMMSSRTLDQKLISAAAYLNAFEFQLWKDEGFREDDLAKRDRLILAAVSELTKQVRGAGLWKISEAQLAHHLSSDSAYLMALGTALHVINERQLANAARYGFEAKSMLHVVVEILQAKNAARSDLTFLDSQPEYVYEGLKEVEDLEMLLMLRANVMMGSAIKKLATAVKPGAKGIEIVATAATMKDATTKLMDAAKMMGLLRQIGVEPQRFVDVGAGIFALNAEWSKIPEQAMGAITSPLKAKLIEAKNLVAALAPQQPTAAEGAFLVEMAKRKAETEVPAPTPTATGSATLVKMPVSN